MQVNNSEFKPKIVAFCCNWCSYAGADLAGTNRLNYPADVKIIRVPCSCRVNPMFILRAFQRGADGVILCGCHPGDCHYTTGNYYARRRMTLLFSMLDYLGIEKERTRVEWVSAAEGAKFAATMNDFVETVTKLGENKRLEDLTMQREMIERAKELLADGTVNRVIGWKAGEFDYDITPAVFTTAEELEAGFLYNDFCAANLSKYLIKESRKEGKVLAFLKPCDTYSFNQLLKEHRIWRDHVYVIGVPCEGKVDVDTDEVPRASRASCSMTLRRRDRPRWKPSMATESMHKGTRRMAERCLNCKSKKHVVYDELMGEEGERAGQPPL